MNVLSVFDGMSCGQIALEKAGIKVDNYFASEIDKYAMQVTQNNYSKTIQLGSVIDVKSQNLPKIDLLIGGSPCQGFSFAGKQLNFEDERSKLFFEFVRLKNETNPENFFLENVEMKKEYEDIITDILGVKPIKINSSLVSAQNRPRIYWTNIVNSIEITDRNLYIEDILDTTGDYTFISDEKTINRRYTKNYLQYDINGKGHGSQDQRAYYLNGKHGCLDTGASGKAKILLEDGRVRKATILECERLQTVPDGYTNIVTESQAKTMLGNGWTIDIIVEFFKNIKSEKQ